MDKKKAVKLATASAVAASAFVAANPHTSQAATDVATVVSQAKAKMKEAYYTYSHKVTETGQFPDIKDVHAAYNKAKQEYANAVAVVNKAGGAKKDAYLADLQATYETYVFKANPKSGEARVATYIDAYNYATKLDKMRQELKAAVDAKDLKKAEELYHKISYELKTRTVILDRVYGQTTRELLRSQFKDEAQKLRDSLIYDITVAMKAREAQDAVKAGNLDKAKAALDQVNQYVSKVNDAFKAELQKAAQDAKAAYEAALTPKVESVSAINVNKIKVTFSKAVDTTKAKFEVKRGTVTEDVKVTWNEAKTEAVLEKTAGNFTPADYTVTVSGVDGLQNATNTVTVQAEEIKQIVINTTQLQKSATAPIAVDFINQYGEKATISATDSKLLITAYDKTKGVSLSPVAGKFQLNASGADLKDEVVVTVMYNGVTATKTLTVVTPATVGSVTLGQAVLPTGKTMFTPSGTKDVELTYTAKNTLDENYTLTASDVSNGAVQFLSSDSSILNPSDISIDANGKIKIAKFGKAGTVTLTAFTPATGAVSKTTIEVKEDAGAPYSVTLGKSTASFAAGSTNPIYVDLSVFDKYGTKIDAKDLKASDYTFTSDNKTVVNSSNISIETTAGSNYGKLKIVPAAGATKGSSALITVTVNGTGQKATLTLSASDAAAPTAIDTKANTTVATNMVVGGTQTLSFDVKDQYGTVVGATPGYTVEYSTSDSSVVAINGTENGDALNAADVSITAVKAGSATVKATLKKNGVAIAEKAYTINVLANDSTKVTYSIPTIAPVYKGALNTDLAGTTIDTNDGLSSAEMKAMVDSGYAEEVVINATDASGNVAQVPTSAVVKVNLTQPTKADGKATKGVLDYFEYNGKYYVYTKTAFNKDDFKNGNGTADLKGKISFTINADDAVKVISQDITVSKDDAVAQSVAFKDKAWNAADAKDAVDVTEFTLDKAADYANAGGKKVFVWAKDQFGGYTAAAETLTLANFDGVKNISDDTVEINPTTGKITITDKNNDTKFTKNNAKFRLIAQSNGETDFVTFTVADGVLPTAAETGAVSVNQAAAGTYAANDKITIKFSEKVKVSNLVGTNGAPQNISIQGGTGATLDASTIAAADADSNGYATTFVITLKGSSLSVAKGNKLVVTANKVEDVAGNTASADVEFLLP
ncbi:hypothetical protein [Geobacillus stearothermophilus]|uniref:hypothetical protein n=1 Tax=Geobacillus stearothermophilus TaxID=1422 RepID=UPI003D1AFCB0